MARTQYLHAIYTGKVVIILLFILAVIFMVDYRLDKSGAYTVAKITDQTEELSNISDIKRGKALSYIEEPYGSSEH